MDESITKEFVGRKSKLPDSGPGSLNAGPPPVWHEAGVQLVEIIHR